MFNSEDDRYGTYMRMEFSGYNSLMQSLHSVTSALSSSDDMELLQALGQLSADLAIAQEDFLATIPLQQLVAVLIECLHKEYMPDIPLYAMTSLISIVDSLPHASNIIVSTGGIQILASKLMNFEFIDLAEHSIKVLEKISLEHSMSIVKEGAFDNMITTMDFFESSIQKRILAIAVNIARNINSREALDKVLRVLPVFIGLLNFRGNESLMQNEKSLDFLTALTDNILRILTNNEEIRNFFNQLKELEAVRNIVELISNASSLLTKAIKMLKYLTKNSAELCSDFLSMGGSDVIKEVLSTPQENILLVSEILKLATAVIPSIDSDNQVEIQKIQIFKDHPQFLLTLTEMILPRTIAMYEELISNESKNIVIEILEKIIRLCPAEQLIPYVSPPSFSNFIAEILCSKEYKMVENAMKIVNVLYDKAINAVSTNFIREGVLHRVSVYKDPIALKSLKPPKDLSQEFPPVLRKFFSHSDMEQSERQIFEDLMSRIRNRSNLDSSGDVLPQLFSASSQEPKPDYSQSLLNLTKSFLEKHKTVENKEAFKPGKELSKIVKKIEASSGDTAYEGLSKLQYSLSSSKRFSCHEICNCKLGEVLLKWLTESKQKNSDFLLKRLYEFLSLFLKDSSTGESYLSILVGLILGAIQYVQNFNITISNSHSYSRKFTQRHRLHFIYTPDPETELNPDFSIKHSLFMSCGNFVISASQHTLFDTIKSAILSAKTVKDLNYLRDYFKNIAEKRMGMEYTSEYSSEEGFEDFSEDRYQILGNIPNREKTRVTLSMNINGLEIVDGMTIVEALSTTKNTESSTVKFKLCILEENIKYSESVLSPSQVYSNIIYDSFKIGLESKNKALPYLRLLKLIYNINETLPIFLPHLLHISSLTKLSFLLFKSPKLTSLISRQMQEQNLFLQSLRPKLNLETLPVLGGLPGWIKHLPKSCKFLFSYTARENYLYSFIIKVPLLKQKVRAQRTKLLENAMSVLGDINLLKHGYLEIDYEDEVGTGTGPSLEFFSLVSKEFIKLKMWRLNEDSSLFPMPIQATCGGWKEYFTALGKFVAKALVDKRQIDLPLNSVFWKLVLNEPVNLLDLLKIDKNLGQTLMEFQELLNKYKTRKIRPFYKGATIESLNLGFTLPGYDEIELKPDGKQCMLSTENIEEYINLVSSSTLLQTSQALAFRQGFETLVPISAIELFNCDEIEELLCGQSGSLWKMADLQENIKPAYGYTANSPVFHNLLITMTEFTSPEQKSFLQFITGSPRLPVGGFAALSPKLTVVRKEPSLPGMHPDEYLPSVMTCQNYLKLPEYTCIKVLQRNLKYAINEGHESFHLS
jgi:E3 ubiquitin-protein ligase TRIP12